MSLSNKIPTLLLAPASRLWDDVIAFLQNIVWPVFDLVVRLGLAQAFLLSGLVKLGNWETALYLATNEYPVSWLPPEWAAVVGVCIEVGAAGFFALGLFTRLAALAMGVLTVVVHVAYVATDINVLSALLFGWYFVMGAGPISLDGALARGLTRLPLPLFRNAAAAASFLTSRLGAFYFLFFRCWIGWVFLAPAIAIAAGIDRTTLGLQQTPAVTFLSPLVITVSILVMLCSIMLIVGMAARISAGLLIIITLTLQFMPAEYGEEIYWLIPLGIILLRGSGRLSADYWIRMQLDRSYPDAMLPTRWDDTEKPNVVIVGAGFGGIALARGLRHAPCRVTLVDRRNYHLFQPLLYQVATAGLSPADIAIPIREVFRDQPNVRVVLGRVTGVETDDRSVLIGTRRLHYDYLALATGARHDYFGNDEWEPLAAGLKKIPDATEIRRRILLAFEEAENAEDSTERRAFLTFVIVGGGPTGVELAGAIAELAFTGMRGEFRSARLDDARVILVQSADRLLPPFPEELSAVTKAALGRLGVEVRLGARVTDINATGISIGDEHIAARTVLWAAGVMASPAAKWLGAKSDRAGRVFVDSDLSVPGLPNVFAIGDTAAANAWNGNPVPGLAPAAKQAGQYVAGVIARRLLGGAAPVPFSYRHAGNLATIGRAEAVADLGRLRLSGSLAWWFWGAVHVLFLANTRSRMSVIFAWIWAYLTFRRGSRLITGNAENE